MSWSEVELSTKMSTIGMLFLDQKFDQRPSDSLHPPVEL
jgi:hypothetical protein